MSEHKSPPSNPNVGKKTTNIIWPQSDKRGNLKHFWKCESGAVWGEVILENCYWIHLVSRARQIYARTLREQSPIPATCNSRSGQHFKSGKDEKKWQQGKKHTHKHKTNLRSHFTRTISLPATFQKHQPALQKNDIIDVCGTADIIFDTLVPFAFSKIYHM